LALTRCAPAAPDTAADLKAIAGVRDAYVAAFNAEDADKASAVYAPDAIAMGANEPQVSGRDAIRENYRKTMSGMDFDIQLKSEETVVTGDWAFDRGQLWLHLMSKDPQSKMPMVMDQGKYLVILRKQPDGSWLVSRVMSNSSIGPPPPPAAPAAAAK
jgi:uncharacterized protein (TIGR02246 family)